MKSALKSMALEWLIEDVPDSALMTGTGQILRSSSSRPFESGLLGLALEISSAYFPMDPADLILLKDPAFGGPGISRLTLVSRLPGQELPLFIATAFEAKGSDRLKFPPLPLRIKGDSNENIWAALGSSLPDVKNEILKHESVWASWDRIREDMSKKAVSEWLNDRQKELRRVLEETPDGEAEGEALLPSGEKLRLKLSRTEKGIEVDLSGTSPGKQLFVPLAGTASLVRQTLRQWLDLDPWNDSGRQALLHLKAPQGCFLHAKATESMEMGLRLAGGPLRSVLEQALHRWDRRQVRGLSHPEPIDFRLTFSPSEILKLRIPSGSPAREPNEGDCFWYQLSGQSELSFEQTEKTLPIRWIRADERTAPQGKNRLQGGRGLHLQVSILREGHLRWFGASCPDRPRLEKHQSNWLASEVKIRREGEELTPSCGEEFPLLPGDTVVILSGAGGGLL